MNEGVWAYSSNDDAAGKDRWLLSYADLLTLLLAFFVVMYSVSAVNETKLAEVSKSLSASFNSDGTPQSIDTPANAVVTENDGQKVAGESEQASPSELLADLGLKADVTDNSDQAITISLPGELLFDSATSTLKSEAARELDKLLPLLENTGGKIEVIGHTDNLPLNTERYPSNWELSAHRAAAAVRYLEQSGIAPARLFAVGRADVNPIADNETEAGRASNRRVVFKANEVNWAMLDAARLLRLNAAGNQSTDSSEETHSQIPANNQESAEPDDQSEGLPPIDAIDPELLEQVLRDLESGGG